MISKKDVEDFWTETCKRGENIYSPEILTFAFLLGLPPAECINMCVEEDDWVQHDIDQYDYVCDILWTLKKGGKRR